MAVTDEDTGGTAKPTKRKTTSSGSRSTSKSRAKTTSAKTGTAKRTTTKAAAAGAGSTSKSAAAPKAETPKAETPKTEAPKPAAAAAAAPATSASAASSSTSSASAASGSATGTGGGTGSGGSGGSGSGGSGRGSYSPPAAAPQPQSSGLITLPTILSMAAIVIAILIPALNQKEAEPAKPAVDTVALQAQQAELVATVADLKATIDAMAAEQEALRTSMQAVKVPAVMVAANDLHEAILSGGAFAEPLNLFQAIVGDSDAVASVYALEPLALVGVPTTRELQAGFGDVSHAVIASYQTVDSEGDLAKRVSETMANLTAATTRLRWRLDGATPPEGTSPLAIMARAEDAAEEADFDTVIQEMEALPENLKAMTSAWVEQVEMQQKAKAATEDLELFMIETVASTRK